ncbi:MAG TPA: chemotaxis protein CheB [Gaiellaceae bacterium]|nr:chemotaxis protein CheB [Gaiellaceae bacterium]
MNAAAQPRVVVADDSAFMRQVLSKGLAEGGFDVVAVVADGDAALAACAEHQPDVLSLDLAMPGAHGLDVLRALSSQLSPIRVVVVSAFSPAYGARAVDALAEGAFELVAKPASGAGLAPFMEELVEKILLAAAAPPSRPVSVATRAVLASRTRPRTASHPDRAVVIACSTGGPRALAELVPHLPERLGKGTLIVQHMPAGFTGSLAERLDRASKLGVREAAGGESLDPGTAVLARGGSHLRLQHGTLSVTDEEPIGGLRPRADLTIRDAAEAFGSDLVLVVLTGMGKDGLHGAVEVKRRAGRVLVEAESTCTVYGMPRAIVEAELADAVLPLDQLPAAIIEEANAR